MTILKKYKLGLLDPPWQYADKQQNNPARGGITYPTLTMQALYDIPLGDAFDADSALVMWATFPVLFDNFYNPYNPLELLKHWGYRPVTALFVWIKTNKRGELITENTDLLAYDSFYSGLGIYTNSNAEIAIIARRGKGLERIDTTVKQVLHAPIGKHSAKPQEQYDRLWRLYGDIPRVELFARTINPPPYGWDATGLEYDGLDIREWIQQYAETNKDHEAD